MCKQVVFFDTFEDLEVGESPRLIGGILLENGQILCGECGSLIDPEYAVIVKEFNEWADISEMILGRLSC